MKAVLCLFLLGVSFTLVVSQTHEGKMTFHYANTPVQHTAVFHGCKNDNFHLIFFFTFFEILLKTYIVGTR